MAKQDQRAQDLKFVPVCARLEGDFGSVNAQAFSIVHGRAPTARSRVSERALKQAEARLGFPLPRALRSFYETLGAERWVMDSHDHICSPSQLESTEGRLVFCIENQDVCRWSVRPDGENPVVEQLDLDGSKWRSMGLSASAYLVLLVFYQAVLGGHRHSGYHEAPKALLRKLKASWECVVQHHDLAIYLRDGSLAAVMSGSDIAYGSARSKSDQGRLVELGFRF